MGELGFWLRPLGFQTVPLPCVLPIRLHSNPVTIDHLKMFKAPVQHRGVLPITSLCDPEDHYPISHKCFVAKGLIWTLADHAISLLRHQFSVLFSGRNIWECVFKEWDKGKHQLSSPYCRPLPIHPSGLLKFTEPDASFRTLFTYYFPHKSFLVSTSPCINAPFSSK